MIDFNPSYKNKYIDGITPYFFKHNKNKRIYLDVFTIDKLIYSINITNEHNNYHRLFEGILDIHKFFIKQKNTTMCSEVDCWSLNNYIIYYIYIIIEFIIIFYITILSKIQLLFISRNNYNKLKPIIEKFMYYFLLNVCF